MRISDWSSDVCSSDLQENARNHVVTGQEQAVLIGGGGRRENDVLAGQLAGTDAAIDDVDGAILPDRGRVVEEIEPKACGAVDRLVRSEEHTSETPVTNAHIVFRLPIEKKKIMKKTITERDE